MRNLIAALALCGCTYPAPAAEQFPDGSIKLPPQEVQQTTNNFAYLIALVKKLNEKVLELEAEKQCKGV